MGLTAVLSPLNDHLDNGPPAASTLRRVTVVGWVEEKRIVVIAAGSIAMTDMDCAHEPWIMSGNRAEKHATDVERNIRSMNYFLIDDTPPTLLALIDSVCHLNVSGDDPNLSFAAREDTTGGTKGVSVHALHCRGGGCFHAG